MRTVLLNSYSQAKPFDSITFDQVSDDIVEVVVWCDGKALVKNCLPRRESAQFMRECRRQGLKPQGKL